MWKLFSLLTLMLAFAASSLVLNSKALDAQLGQGKPVASQADIPFDDGSDGSEDNQTLASAYEDHIELSAWDLHFQDIAQILVPHSFPRLQFSTPLLELHRPPEA